MFVNFTFEDGSNSYVSTNNKTLFYMLRKYHYIQTGEKSFHILNIEERNSKIKYTRDINKSILRNIAMEWIYSFSELNYSYGDLADWSDFFREYGKKYGLLREFKEDAIL